MLLSLAKTQKRREGKQGHAKVWPDVVRKIERKDREIERDGERVERKRGNTHVTEVWKKPEVKEGNVKKGREKRKGEQGNRAKQMYVGYWIQKSVNDS